MRLVDLLAGEVPAQLQERGRTLHLKGAVFIQAGSSTEVRARVVGTRLYTVSLHLDEASGRVDSFCDCPYFEGGAPFCKHLWGTFLTAAEAGHLTGSGARLRQRPEQRLRPDPWELVLRAVSSEQAPGRTSGWPDSRRLTYQVDAERTRFNGRLTMDIVTRDRRRDGTWGKAKPLSISARTIADLPDPADREILSMILGAADPWRNYYAGYGKISGGGLVVPEAVIDSIVPAVCRTGRGLLQPDGVGEPVPLTLDEGPSWELCLRAAPEDAGSYTVQGVLRREEQTVDPADGNLMSAGAFLFGPDGMVYPLSDPADSEWIAALRRQGPMRVPVDRADDFLAQVLRLPRQPRLDLPPELAFQRAEGKPQPILQITPGDIWARSPQLRAALSFNYDGELIEAGDPAPVILKSDPRRVLVRNAALEADAPQRLAELGLKLAPGQDHWLLHPNKLPAAVRVLLDEGWRVEAEGSLYRSAGAAAMRVKSGVDWFELEGSMKFADQVAELPELLAAMRRGEGYVRLGDGSIGLVPEEWLAQYRAVAGLGKASGEGLRFERSQIGLIDALLAARPEVTFDETFKRARQGLLDFKDVSPMAEPPGFVGTLRPYQRDGLGWFDFLARMGFGGCLADDMGLGKTIQVLALLQARAASGGNGDMAGRRPSLVVVPKSLVFNWMDEAQRFTPNLRILDHTGQRDLPGSHFEDYHLVITTYGTLRRDIAFLADVPFDYCILDEAQAIKNPATAAAKAARLIRADHRLALSGTPIENHLGELWSLFDFLNPGMLGSVAAFQKGLDARDPDAQARKALSQALRPFLLRRTKEQVAGDLPPKTELTQYCELSGPQRKHYDQLRTHYRTSLLDKVDREGMNQAKMFVLEALLRLRQAACHPGLIDPRRTGEPSAKLDLLVPQLLEVADEGHKALVFSQFTSFLAIVREHLDREGVPYEYLDGRTRDRQARVANFQTNPDCRIFLISLKAGGLGLNLTAAEYVFLLDPWWNPAVEAQAVDRAHRIGQDKPVMAYRIITKDTVEEKVLQLQQSKRELADAIIGADNSLIRKIRREDLELLLS